MHFLRRLLKYPKVCIQCHDLPDADAIASAFGVYRYLRTQGVEAEIVYGGAQPIRKMGLRMLIRECGIPVSHAHGMGDARLLLTVDCQYGQGHVERFEAADVAVIDHHVRVVAENDMYMVDSGCQSCSTLVWRMLREEGYPLEEDALLRIALLYGLYTDTSCFADLYGSEDMEMRKALFAEQPLFERLCKANMSVAELLIASEAMLHHHFDGERHFAMVQALTCDQAVLGIIGDFMIQVDAIWLTFAFTQTNGGYQISLRTCHESLRADHIAAFVCQGIGSGGGHPKKGGGFIVLEKFREKYGDDNIFSVIHRLLCEWVDRMIPGERRQIPEESFAE